MRTQFGKLKKVIPSKECGCDGKTNLGRDFQRGADRLSVKHGKRYGVYRCPHCGGHHLTTKLAIAEKYFDALVYITPINLTAQPTSKYAPLRTNPGTPGYSVHIRRS